MLLQIFQLLHLQHARCHVLVLQSFIGEYRRRQIPLQIHMGNPLHILRGDVVIAFPDLF
ncbi:hypothetical protein D3C76_1706030 [compost metagenome]